MLNVRFQGIGYGGRLDPGLLILSLVPMAIPIHREKHNTEAATQGSMLVLFCF